MKKVFLIYPPSGRMLREDRCQVPGRNVLMSPLFPPTDLMSLAAVAEQEGCWCRIEDYSLSGRSETDFMKDLREFSPDILVISVTSPTINADLEAAAVAKKILPELKVVAKGAHFLRFSRETLSSHADLDIVIRGETEVTFREIVSGRELTTVSGIAWRSARGIVVNPDRPFLKDLDSLPFPARHLVDNRRYVRPDTDAPQAVIRVSRGCPYHCFFCLATPLSGPVVRMRSPANIVKEIGQCVETFGMRDFVFWSDFFSYDRQWVIALCQEIISSGHRIRWSANTRADAVDAGMLRQMKEAGCTLVSIGVESGNQEMLEQLGKKTTLQEIRKAFLATREADIKSLAYFIFGLPWETKESAEDTIQFALELESDYASFFVAAPLPGSRYFEYAVENGLLAAGQDIDDSFCNAYYGPVARGHYLDGPEILACRGRALRAFYLRPGYIAKRIQGMRTWKEFVNHLKSGISLLKSGAE